MDPETKLYQLLEKAKIDTKIAIEIQDWIEDTFEKKQAISMFQFQETKQLPMQKDLKNDLDSLRSESDYKFEKLIIEMRAGFKAVQDEIKSQTEIMNGKFEALETKLEAKFDAIDHRFEALETKFEAKFGAMDSKFEAKFDAVDHWFESMDSKSEAKFESLEKRLDSTNFYLRLIAVPIIGATLSGVSVTFLYFWERIQ